MVFKIAYSFITSMLTFCSGSLVVMSGSLSSLLIFLLSKLTKNADEIHLYIILTTEFVGISLFVLFLLGDYRTGIRAAKYLNFISDDPKEDWKESSKMYKTLWKFLGVCLISIMLMFLSLFAAIIDSNFIWVFLWFLVGFWILACSFEFHSIGENIKKFSGNKPEIFLFWEKITKIVESKFIRKVEDSFNILDQNDEKNNNK